MGGFNWKELLELTANKVHWKQLTALCCAVGAGGSKARFSVHTNVKDRKNSHRQRRRASTNLHTSNERCQFKLYIDSYWTSNSPSRVLVSHLMSGQKVKGQGQTVTKCTYRVEGDRVARMSLHTTEWPLSRYYYYYYYYYY